VDEQVAAAGHSAMIKKWLTEKSWMVSQSGQPIKHVERQAEQMKTFINTSASPTGEAVVTTYKVRNDHYDPLEYPWETMVYASVEGEQINWSEIESDRYINEVEAVGGHESMVTRLVAIFSTRT